MLTPELLRARYLNVSSGNRFFRFPLVPAFGYKMSIKCNDVDELIIDYWANTESKLLLYFFLPFCFVLYLSVFFLYVVQQRYVSMATQTHTHKYTYLADRVQVTSGGPRYI